MGYFCISACREVAYKAVRFAFACVLLTDLRLYRFTYLFIYLFISCLLDVLLSCSVFHEIQESVDFLK